MITAPLLAHVAAAATLALSASLPAALPANASLSAVYAQIQQSEGHYHEGELGELFLQIESNLKCNCGCNLDVHSCQFQMQCGTSPAWSDRIRTQLEQGMTPEAIEAGFVAEFGPTVLMTPPAEGFNLVGYLLPALAIVTAGMLVGLVARGGVGRRETDLAPVHEVSDAEEERLREAMKRMDESESPDW